MRKGRCPLCDHREIIEAVPAEFIGGYERRVAVTYDKRWLSSARNASYPHGLLLMYVCRECGYTQWFAAQPDEIPIGEDYKTRVIKGPPVDAPYR